MTNDRRLPGTAAELSVALSVTNPTARARLAGELITVYLALMRYASVVRRDAVMELVELGASRADVAAKLGISRARVQQLVVDGLRNQDDD